MASPKLEEMTILCSMIKERENVLLVRSKIKDRETFSLLEHKILFDIINELFDAYDAVNRGLIVEHIYNKKMQEIVTEQLIGKILLSEYDQKILNVSIRNTLKRYHNRLMEETLTKNLNDIKSGKISPKSAIENLSKITSLEISDEHSPQKISDINVKSEKVKMYSTSLRKRDDAKYRSKNIVIISGRPSMGKTTLALQESWDLAKQGYKVYIASLEMTKQEVLEKIYLIEKDVASIDHLSEQEKEDILESFKDEISNIQFIIEDDMSADIDTIIYNVKRENMYSKVDFFVLDHLQFMLGESKEENGHKILSEVSKKVKRLAKEIDACAILLSQLGRQVDMRDNKRPLMSDMKESGSLEQDATLIFGIFRPEHYGVPYINNISTAGLAKIIVLKNRFGTFPIDIDMHFGTGEINGNEIVNNGKAVKFRNMSEVGANNNNNNNNNNNKPLIGQFI